MAPLQDKLRLVHSQSQPPFGPLPFEPLDFEAEPEELPRVLIATGNADRYSDLPAEIDWAPDGLSALSNAIQYRYDYIFVDALQEEGRASACGLIQELRRRQVKTPVYLVMDNPLPQDRHYAAASGASDVLDRDRVRLAELLRGDPIRQAVHYRCDVPEWLLDVIAAMRLFLASEAEPRVRRVYANLCARRAGRTLERQEVVNEAARLLDDPDDERAFRRLLKLNRGR
jgi:CheY-like chemotaxis protein